MVDPALWKNLISVRVTVVEGSKVRHHIKSSHSILSALDPCPRAPRVLQEPGIEDVLEALGALGGPVRVHFHLARAWRRGGEGIGKETSRQKC